MLKNRAHSVLTIKGVDTEQRIIRGIATTPSPDRVRDIVVPEGVKFTNPMPLLWQHQHDKPVGTVKFSKPTSDGIEFEAQLPHVSEDGTLKDRVDEAWQSVQHGLVRGVSIGFRALKYAYLDDGGIQFDETEVYELSLVTIPANAEATITEIKSADSRLLAASGREQSKPVDLKPAGVTAKKSVKLSPVGGNDMKISEQIKALDEAKRAKAAQMTGIMQKAADEGRTLDQAEQDEFDGLQSEVDSIEGDMKRLKTLEAMAVETAVPVSAAGKGAEGASQARAGVNTAVTVKHNVPKGVAFAQVAKCLGLAKGNHMAAAEIAKKEYAADPRIGNILKAAVVAGSTTSGNWAENLVSDESAVFADFIEYLRPQTILGKFGQGNVPALRSIPFNTPLVGQTGGGEAYWVGEGKPKPLTSLDFSRTTLPELKVATIAVVTDELLRRSSPSADLILRDTLAAAVAGRLDTDFIDPTKAASSGVSPASITYGVSAPNSAGNDADSIRADLRTLFMAFIAADNTPTSGVYIMSSTTALSLSLMMNALGQPEFPGISMTGGTLMGLPVIVSEYVPTVSAGSYVALVNASDIYLGDEGGIMIDVSREASLEMLDGSLTQNALAGTGASLVSLWQNNLMGFRCERIINWGKRRASAVALIDSVNWGAPA